MIIFYFLSIISYAPQGITNTLKGVTRTHSVARVEYTKPVITKSRFRRDFDITMGAGKR